MSSPSIMFVYSPLLIGLTLIGVGMPFASARFIDALAYERSPYGPFAVLAILSLLKAVLTPALQRFICARARDIETDLQFHVLDATMNLSPSRLDTTANGELVAKMTRDAYAVGGFVRGLFPRVVQATVMMFAAGFALFVRSTVLAISFMAFFPVAILLFVPFVRRFSENSRHVRRQGDASFNALFDFLHILPFLRTLDAERRFADTPQAALTALKNGNDKTDSLFVRFGFLLGLLLVGGEIAVLGVAGAFAAKGEIPVGDVVLYQLLFISAIQSIQGVISLLPELAALREGAASLCEMLERENPARKRGPLAPLKTLSFRHVTFAYSQTPDRPVIRDFSATFNVGTIVGFSGSNGAGKSTLLKLSVGALEPQGGEILLNGIPLAESDLSLFRKRIGIVFQDNLLVTGTIRDNITLRNPDFTQQDIDKALALSGFDSVVRQLPDGLDTHVGNSLRSLSGGERQRLAIARAVIRDPMILVLDEATNHLDAGSRHALAGLIARLRPGRLVLLAGHDAELDKLCDVKISCQISKEASYVNV